MQEAFNIGPLTLDISEKFVCFLVFEAHIVTILKLSKLSYATHIPDGTTSVIYFVSSFFMWLIYLTLVSDMARDLYRNITIEKVSFIKFLFEHETEQRQLSSHFEVHLLVRRVCLRIIYVLMPGSRICRNSHQDCSRKWTIKTLDSTTRSSKSIKLSSRYTERCEYIECNWNFFLFDRVFHSWFATQRLFMRQIKACYTNK